MIIVLSGEPGTGKSYQSMFFEEPIVILDMENRVKPIRDKYFKERMIDILPLKKYDSKYNEDYHESYLALKEAVQQVVQGELPATIVVDGISDIRNNYAMAEWLHRHTNRKKATEFDYAEINKITKNILMPLVNLSRDKGCNLVLTAQFTDRYGAVTATNEHGQTITKSGKLGREPEYKDYISYEVDALVELTTDRKTKTYKAICTKSIVGLWEEDITGKKLYEVLLEKGL